MTEDQNNSPEAPEVEAADEKAVVESTEKEFSRAVDSLVDIDDDAPIEADGDIFWTIQQIFWGIIKTVVVLGGILLLLWFIWRPDTSFFENFQISESSIQEETTPVIVEEEAKDEEGWFSNIFKTKNVEPIEDSSMKTPEEDINQETESPLPSIDTDDVTDIAYEIEDDRTQNAGSIISKSLEWLKRAKALGEVSLEVIRIREPQERVRRIEEVLQTADTLFANSITIQQLLISERDELLVQGQAYNQKTAELDLALKSNIAKFQPHTVEPILTQKIESQQLAVFYMQHAKLRDTLLRNVQTFDQLLRQKSIPLLKPATEIRAN